MEIITLALIILILIVLGCKKTCIKTKSKKIYIIFGTKHCGYTVKQIKHLENKRKMEEFEYQDIRNNKEYEKLNVDGVPCIYNKRTQKHIVGYHVYKDIVNKLK